MQLTRRQLKALKRLLAWRCNPPTWRRLLPKLLALTFIWAVILVGYVLLFGGPGSPLMYYCLGVLSAFPLVGLAVARQSISRWPLNEAIIKWERVEELVAAAGSPNPLASGPHPDPLPEYRARE